MGKNDTSSPIVLTSLQEAERIVERDKKRAAFGKDLDALQEKHGMKLVIKSQFEIIDDKEVA